MALQRKVTQEDLDTNPILIELGAVVGDVCSIVVEELPELPSDNEAPAPQE